MNTAADKAAMSPSSSIALNIQLACIWEASARKPGNVHRYRDFAESSYVDFLQSAAAVAPVLAADAKVPVGAMVFEAVRLSSQVTASNTHLGIILLLAPLAKAAAKGSVRTCLPQVLNQLDRTDAELVYTAIRLANPGGLGRVADQDVSDRPTQTLREVMVLAADRDLVARQYANGFREVLEEVVPAVLQGVAQTGSMEAAIVYGQLKLMAAYPDSLIRRKRGCAEAAESAEKAQQILAADWPNRSESWEALHDFDAWLRALGNKRNPGTTADLIAASLFVLLQEDRIKLPIRFLWPEGFERR
jgi:triphosphoribosyl-dephospho-CoA synthase